MKRKACAKDPPAPIELLIEQLHGADWTARCNAARVLGQNRHPRATQPHGSMGSPGKQHINILLVALTRFQNEPDTQAESEDPVTRMMQNTLNAMVWKIGVMVADTRDASQDRLSRLMEMLGADAPLKRSAAV